ncbi:hypothetical protein F5X68DRAFT_206323 [Plectosphaerella plurivora]|uniref:Uncharacterized protein n=1 Tax=Plectosphaerella plurivora TaxID=936078 RepID=A0A9P8VC39_9PEZI|nr:hypothetical protein F5X68DRAFT_206323 [Plectosphaerella plurivora]
MRGSARGSGSVVLGPAYAISIFAPVCAGKVDPWSRLGCFPEPCLLNGRYPPCRGVELQAVHLSAEAITTICALDDFGGAFPTKVIQAQVLLVFRLLRRRHILSVPAVLHVVFLLVADHDGGAFCLSRQLAFLLLLHCRNVLKLCVGWWD